MATFSILFHSELMFCQGTFLKPGLEISRNATRNFYEYISL
jgi:hypothetical protein